MKGVSVPNSEELNAVKEMAANMGSSLEQASPSRRMRGHNGCGLGKRGHSGGIAISGEEVQDG